MLPSVYGLPVNDTYTQKYIQQYSFKRQQFIVFKIKNNLSWMPMNSGRAILSIICMTDMLYLPAVARTRLLLFAYFYL